ncbi:MAG: DUF11 domain-containing protein [Saprospiraceae bacterium]|nr:DUF11 domain-containing protein [Saprospiraceae bacterium]
MKTAKSFSSIVQAALLQIKSVLNVFLVIGTLIPVSISGQFTGTLSSTESICLSDGTVKVSGADPTSLYIITGPGIPQTSLGPGSSMYTFTDLPKGTFTVTEVELDNDEFTASSTVTSTYEQNWQFLADVTFKDCSGGAPGKICINITGIIDADPFEQRPPYTYRISAPNGTLPNDGAGLPPYGSDTEFCTSIPSDWAGKTFKLQAKDACGNFKTYTIQVPLNPPPPALNSVFKGFSDCAGNSLYEMTGGGGTAPYLFTIVSGPGTPTSSTTNPTNFVFPPNSTSVVRVRDECGGFIEHTITTGEYIPPCLSVSANAGKCDPLGMGPGTATLYYCRCDNGIGPYTIDITSDCGYSATITNAPVCGVTPDLPRPCKVTITVTDACGKTNMVTYELIGPGPGAMSCGGYATCPSVGSQKINWYNYYSHGAYIATYPIIIDLKDNMGNSLPGYPAPMNYGDYQNYQALDPGSYSYSMVDACGATCGGNFTVPLYEEPTVTVDNTQKCFGSGVITLIGVNKNPVYPAYYSYQIIAGPSDVGKYSEIPDVPNTGKFSKLVSGGTYTFQFTDGCHYITVTETVPTWTQPTYDVGYGLVCEPAILADMNIYNLQPAPPALATPYYWQIIGTTSNAYASTPPYNGTLPYPPYPGQQDSSFAGLPPNLDLSTATYTIQGYDACGNSYINIGKVGLFPSETLILDKTEVCAGGSCIKARVSDYIIGAKYQYFRDGIKVAESNKLFTNICPALPGTYTARIVAGIAPDTCVKETSGVLVTATAEIKITNPDPKCPNDPVDLTAPAITAGSTPGVLSYWQDLALTIPLTNPSMVTVADTYYIRLITMTTPSCDISAPVYVTNKGCRFDLALQKVLTSAGPFVPGDDVTFTITVYNQGQTDAFNINVTDYIPTGMSLNDSDWTLSGSTATLNTPIASLLIGASTTVDITLKIDDLFQGTSLTNWAEISSADIDTDPNNTPPVDFDSDPDGTNFNQPGETDDLEDDNVIDQEGKMGGDEDDHDPAQITIVQTFDLALRKVVVTPGPYTYGQTIDYRITVFNQGTLIAKDIEVSDSIPSGYTYVPSDNPTWTGFYPKVKTTIAGPMIPGDSSFVIIKLKLNNNPGSGSALINKAEISDATDGSGNPVTDIDSDMDDNFGNDIGGEPFGSTDNEINDAGANDEDDADPAGIKIWDLALKKVVTTAGPYVYGQDITFTITVYNQGTESAQNVQISDYIPEGYTLNDANWSGSPIATRTLAGPIAPGDNISTTIVLKLEMVANPDSKSWMNYSEITASEDESGTDRTNDDVDSDAGSNGPNENGIVEDGPGDDDINSISDTDPGSQDDHDPAGIEIFDLALRKVVTTAGPYTYGQTIDFRISVFNQGNVGAKNIKITDYIPSGYSFNSGDNPGWIGGSPIVETTLLDPLAPGDSTFVVIKLKLLPNPSGANALVNDAEISRVEDLTGTSRTDDIDSSPDAIQANDPGGVVYSGDDNEIGESGKAGDDEDDHDPAGIKIWDLALKKVVTTAGPYAYGQDITFTITVYNQGTESAQDLQISDYIPEGFTLNDANWSGSPIATRTLAGPIAPGDNVSTTIVLKLEMVANPDSKSWMNYSEITASEDESGTDRTNDDVDSDAGSNGTNENGIVEDGPGDDDINSISDTDPGSQDDHDPAGIEIFDLALRKVVTTAGPYTYGQTIDFRISVFNQGNVGVKNIKITDYIPSGYSFNSSDNPNWTGGSPIAETTILDPLAPGDSTFVVIKLKLLPNPSGSNVLVNDAEISRVEDLTGTSRTDDIDSSPDATQANDPGGVVYSGDDNEIEESGKAGDDEDDHDPAGIQIWDLALTKVLSTAGPYAYGQDVIFTLTIYNQGTEAAQNIEISDYIPEGFELNDANWSGSPIATRTLTGPLAAGDDVTTTIVLKFVSVANPDPKSWINYSEITKSEDLSGTDKTNDDVDSDAGSNGTNENNILPGGPGDNDVASVTDSGVGSQDDHDPDGLSIFDLALRKVVTTAGPYTYGQLVDFRISVFNQGTITAQDIEISDYIPSGFSFSGTDNPDWTGGGSLAKTTIQGPLASGDSTFVVIRLKVLPNPGSAKAYVNDAEISRAEDLTGTPRTDDIDSSPDGNQTNDNGGIVYSSDDNEINESGKNGDDEDDHDPAGINIWDLALNKKLDDPGPYAYGDKLPFTITVYNQGTETAQNIEVSDYIPAGYIYNAGDNPDWTGTAPTVTTTIAGPLAPGDNAKVTIILELAMANGPREWYNYSEITGSEDTNETDRTNDDVDSQAGSNNGTENGINPGGPGDDDIANIDPNGNQDDHDPAAPWIFDLATIITNDDNFINSYGENVTFAISVVNQGNIPSAGYTLSVNVPDGFIFDGGINPGWIYNSLTGVASLVIPATDTIKPGETNNFNIVLKAQPASGVDAWTVEVEISKDKPVAEEAGIKDIDSSPDANFGNDAGGNPIPDSEGGNFPGSDDILSGNGTGAPDDTDAATDEDDNDPEFVQVFDLALKKTLANAAPYTYNSIHTFYITVYNQGNIAAKNIVVSDYIPDGYAFTDNNGWTGPGPIINNLITSTIRPGDSVVLQLDLAFVMASLPTTNKTWINYSEIVAASDTTDTPRTDVDSGPGSNGPNENSVLPGKPGDDNITSTSDTGTGSQDDHDPAGPWIFDLATIIENEDDFIASYGDQVKFPIKVVNQGNIPSAGYTISVDVPSGFVFDPNLNTGWTYNSFTGVATYVVSVFDTIMPGQVDSFGINLIAQPVAAGDYLGWTVDVEISQDRPVADEVGINDIDSNPDANFTNDAGGSPMPDSEGGSFPGSDDILAGDGTGSPNDTNATGDEDDNDPEYVQVFDLALKKTLTNNAPYNYGELHTFKITVYNQGSVTAQNIEVKDYIPDGYTFVDNNNWTGGPAAGPGVTVKTTIPGPLKPGESTELTLEMTFVMATQQTSNKTWINYSEIASAQDSLGAPRKDIDSDDDTNGPNENNVLPGKPGDDNITSTSDTGLGSQDDHDPAGPWIFDLATIIENDDDFILAYGEDVTFSIKTVNQGNIPSAGYTISVDVPEGFKFNAADNAGWTYNPGTGVASYVYPVTDIINPGETDLLNLVLEAQPASAGNYLAWTVESEISQDNPVADEAGINDIDSNPDSNFTNDNGGSPMPDSEGGNFPGSDDILSGDGADPGAHNDTNASTDEDDNDPEYVQVFDLALKKTLLNNGPYNYGELHTFNITVYNQGSVTAQNIAVYDYIPDGYTFVDNNNWTGGPAAGPGATVKTTIAGPLKPGDSTVLTLDMTFVMATQQTSNKTWINYSEIVSAEDTLGVERPDVDSEPGSNGPNENNVLPGKPGDDNITSTSDTGLGSQDDHDPAGPWIFDLATIIENDDDFILAYGEDVTFSIKTVNQGNIPSAGYTINVDVPEGFKFNAADNAGWTYNPGTGVASYVYPVTDIINPGETDLLKLVLEAQPASAGNYLAWTVESEISQDNPVADEAGINDIDSNPDSNFTNDNGGSPMPDSEGGNFPGSDDILSGDGADPGAHNDTNAATDEDDNDPEYVQVFDLALKKTLTNNAPYNYGDLHTFKITVYNQGSVTAQNIAVKDYIPDGYTFVNNNGWTGGPAAGPGATVNTTIAGPLKPGDSTVLTLNMTFVMATQQTSNKTWINYSEIASAQDTLGVVRPDVDSDDDSNGPNENSILPGKPGDDNITSISDTGTGSQDDHDPAGPWIFDLATIIENDNDLVNKYGDDVTFPITTVNQGNIPSAGYTLSVNVPAGFKFNAADNPGWTYNAGTGIATFIVPATDTINPGDTQTRSIILEAQPVLPGSLDNWTVEIEISDDNPVADEVGINDIDSDPDSDFANDNGGNPLPDSESGNYPGSDDILGGDGTKPGDHLDTNAATDEDDNDPEFVQIVDLALRKWVPNEKLYYLPDDTVHFVISLHNQGNITSAITGVRDYMPHGYIFSSAINPGWTQVGTDLEYSHNSNLYPGDSVQLWLKLIVQIPSSNVTPYSWENYSEITSVIDTNQVDRTNDDADSEPGSNTPWEKDVHDDTAWDDIIDGNGQPNNEDEDDHDPEKVTVTAYLGDKVWKDTDGDGIQDVGEPGIKGVEVILYDCVTGNVVKKDTTDVNGEYGFEALLSGNYFVRFMNPDPENCGFTFKDSTSNDKTDSDVNPAGISDCTFLDWGERDSTMDAGLVLWASYGDYIWHDRDVDGMQESGEEPVPGVLVTLYDAKTNLPIRTALTDANGLYHFEKLLPGSYYAKYDPPAGWNITDPNVGPDFKDSDVDGSNGPRTNATTFLSPGEDDLTWDLGLWKCAMIGGRVFLDADFDGIFDPTENGINGLEVHLVNAMTGVTVTKLRTGVNPATPSDDGYYKYACIKPGMYYLRFERPGHLAASDDLKGSDRNRDSDINHANGVNTTRKFTVRSEDMFLNVGAGFMNKAVVGDYVWLDANANGIQEFGEEPLEGVNVFAVRPNGTIVSESKTGTDGHYTLDGIAQGDYYVRFEPPFSYGFTLPNAGNDPVNSDVDGTNGWGTTKTYRILVGDDRPTIDAGLVFQVLPLEWLGFEGRYNGNFTELDWKTGVEINNDHFEVERRHESEASFTNIANVSASQDLASKLHEYNHDDYNVSKSGIYYYRIKQVDRNGKFTYSKTISIRVDNAKELSLIIYPNPTDNNLNIEIGMAIDSELEVRVFDETGKNVLTNPFGGFRKAGTYRENLNTSILAVGQYNLQIKTTSGIINKRFIVAR